MVRRGEITDEAWEQISPLLPENGRRGKQWRNHRRVMNGILWRLRTGAPWREVPERYGPWQTCYDRFVRWRHDGTWEKLLSRIQTKSDAVGEIEWEVSVDSSVARAHQHAAGARRKRSKEDAKRGPGTRPMRRSGGAREDFPPSCNLCCDGKGRPLSVVCTGGQRHESTQLGTVLDEIEVPRVGRGRPRKKPDHLIADKGYSYPGCRDLLRKRGIPHTIPERRDQRRRRARRPGRKPGFEKATYPVGATSWSVA